MRKVNWAAWVGWSLLLAMAIVVIVVGLLTLPKEASAQTKPVYMVEFVELYSGSSGKVIKVSRAGEGWLVGAGVAITFVHDPGWKWEPAVKAWKGRYPR